MNVLVLAHGKEITPGWLLDAFVEIEADHMIIDLSLGDEIPAGRWDKVVVLGGHMGAYQVDDYPWLATEKEFIRLQLNDETPVLGGGIPPCLSLRFRPRRSVSPRSHSRYVGRLGGHGGNG